MLEADHLPPATATPFWRPERKAWAIMLAAFAIFCALASVTSSMLYRLALAPRPERVTAHVANSDVAFLQRAGLIRSEMLVDGTPLSAGDRVSTTPNGPPGIAARLQLGRGVVGLWPGSGVLIEQRDRETVRLRLEGGQALIDLPVAGRSLYVTAPPLAQEVELAAPGRYRVRIFAREGLVTAVAERHLAPGMEVTTDQGLARIGDLQIPAGQRVEASEELRRDVTRWELVRDGDFSAFSAAEYLATLQAQSETRRADTWIITQTAQSEGAFWRNGLFYRLTECGAPMLPAGECRNYARLARLGGNEKGSITAIGQDISADVASYRSVTLEADVRIDYQSLSKGGASGSECPLFARVDYANATQTGLQKYFCFWAYDYGSGETSSLPYIVSQQIEPKTWYHFRTDLRALLPDLRVVQQLIFYSNGHDYDASVTGISLRAEGLVEARQQ